MDEEISRDKILREYPLILAKMVESVGLETDAQLKVRKLVELFEETVRYLSLAGLALVDHFGLKSPQVREARKKLTRPTLGDWYALLEALDDSLREQEIALIAPSMSENYYQDPIQDAYLAIMEVLDQRPAKKLRIKPFLSAIVELRNKKIGHGHLAPLEAKRLVGSLDQALTKWMVQLPLIEGYELIYVHDVKYQDPDFLYQGTNINEGTSMFAASIMGAEKISPAQVYLHKDDVFVSLFPYLVFDNDSKLLYLYTGLSNKYNPSLKCPYDISNSNPVIELDVKSEKILAGPKRKAVTPPEPKSKPQPTDDSDLEKSKEYSTMKTWYEIIPPHEDIRKGNFDESVFAADLGDVAAGTAKQDYNDPYLFYKKTYPTQGLLNLLKRVHTTITTETGSSVVQIQTPFGGGKTHALVAIYHYAKNGRKIKELLPAGLDIIDPKVSAIAGNHMNPLEGRTSDGITRLTFWGEIAYQIGGKEGYESFRKNDEARISPGKEKIRDFLEAHQPFVLLFDEILEYINRAIDVRDQVEGSLGTQTFSFFQELTEAVSTLPNGMLVVTLPSSNLEDFGEDQEESLARLGKIFGRVESIETPVQGEEVYAVIRRRLFDVENLKHKEMREVVHRYFQTYQQYRDDVPAKARDVNYRDKMELAFPFHPDLIDILYEKWSTFSSFQRTRGVLRLLANVVEDLYQSEKPIDLILPGDINLGHSGIRQEFLKHITNAYEGVIGSDISGHEAKAQDLDSANKNWKHLAERIATSIFYHSFAADDSEKGISLNYIRLAVLQSDTIPALVTDVLQRLSNTLWYLNSRGDAFYFSRIPNLNRMILDKKDLFGDSYEDEMRERIKREIGNKFRTYLWPTSSEEIPDNQELKLIILQPNDSGAEIPNWIEYKGNNYRHYKNTLFFALPDTAHFAQLREDIKTYLALKEIDTEIRTGKMTSLEAKRDEVDQRKRAIEREFSYKIRRMYHMIQVGERKIDLGNPITGSESLDNWIWRELSSDAYGVIVPQLHYKVLVNKFMSNVDQLSTKALLEQFYKEPSLPSLANSDVLVRAIQLGITEGAFGLAEVKNGEIVPETLKFRQDILFGTIAFMDDYHLISAENSTAIIAEREKPGDSDSAGEPGPGTPTPTPTPEPPGSGGLGPEPSSGEVRYKHIKLNISGVPASKIADLNRGVLLPISSVQGDFKFSILIDITTDEGITQSTLENKIRETIRQIGARIDSEKIE